jgi:hypothetical protein
MEAELQPDAPQHPLIDFTQFSTVEIRGYLTRTQRGFYVGGNVDLKLMSETLQPETFRQYIEFSRELRLREPRPIPKPH